MVGANERSVEPRLLAACGRRQGRGPGACSARESAVVPGGDEHGHGEQGRRHDAGHSRRGRLHTAQCEGRGMPSSAAAACARLAAQEAAAHLCQALRSKHHQRHHSNQDGLRCTHAQERRPHLRGAAARRTPRRKLRHTCGQGTGRDEGWLRAQLPEIGRQRGPGGCAGGAAAALLPPPPTATQPLPSQLCPMLTQRPGGQDAAAQVGAGAAGEGHGTGQARLARCAGLREL